VDLDKSKGRVVVDAICPSRDGGLWIESGRRLRKWKNSAWADSLTVPPEALDAVTALQETPEGGVLVGTPAQGLYLFSPDAAAQHFTQTNGLAQNWIACLYTDREGNIWAGSGNGGLSMLRPVNFERLNPPDKWNGMAVLSITVGRNGGLWIGTEGAGLYHFENGNWSHFAGEDGLANKFVWSVLEDSKGQLWVGTWGGGLFVPHGTRFEVAEGLEKVRTPMPALLEGRDGQIWAGTGSGLLRYDQAKTAWFGAKKGLKVPDVRAVYEDTEGTVWFGMQGGGLGCLKEGRVRQYWKEDGLASEMDIHVVPVLLGTMRGSSATPLSPPVSNWRPACDVRTESQASPPAATLALARAAAGSPPKARMTSPNPNHNKPNKRANRVSEKNDTTLTIPRR
jgi:ligand-binding sensor domain-containing protein